MKSIQCTAALGALLIAASAHAGISTYFGIDPGAGPADARPNSDATAGLFDADAAGLGAISIIDFEDLPIGDFDSLEIAPGVTATLTGTDPDGGIQADGWFGGFDPPIIGYNTTDGGSQFLGFVPVTDIGTAMLTLEFDTPILALGSYLLGLGTANGDLFVEFVNGGPQMIPVTGDDLGGAAFWGFTDAGGDGVSSVTLSLRGVVGTRDIFALDDLRFVTIPGPATAALFLVAMLGGGRRRAVT